MARLPYLDAEDLAEGDRSLLSRPANLFRAYVHSPGAFRNFSRLGGYIRNGSTLDPRLRELAILQVGYLTRNEYEYTHHIQLGRDQFGVSTEDIHAISAETGGADSGLPDLDRAVLRLAREMTDEMQGSAEAFETVLDALGEEHTVDLVTTIAFYNLVVRVLFTLEIDLEDDYRPLLEKFPLPAR